MSDRPKALPVLLDRVPAVLRGLDRWIVWRHQFNESRGRWIKFPLTTGLAPASVAAPDSWTTFDRAARAYGRGQVDGIGFVFAGDGLIGVDVDKCIVDGDLSDVARAALSIPGYAELSPSGNGLHIITRAALDRARKSDAIGLELYSTGRYFTITGQPVPE